MSLEALAPIIVRSGRPMNAHTDADPARFPPPSTVAGCLRTAWARATEQPFSGALAELEVAGPLLIDGDGNLLAPKPADALYFGQEDAAVCVRAEPRYFGDGCAADLPENLLPVQLTTPIEGKPGDGPTWWSWHDLLAFRRGSDVPLDILQKNGWSPPKGDQRTHVSINPDSGTAASGALYETEGLDLGTQRVLVRCAEALAPTLVHLGGKRRLAALEPEREEVWPTPPAGWLERIGRAGGLCLTLLTPAVFSKGYRPGWLDETLTGSPPDAPELTLRLRAAAVERWQPHSGWDLDKQRPKPMRKLVPAGATYWFDVVGNREPAVLKPLWLTSICDALQDRRDGFGLALPAPWTPPGNAGS